MSNTVDTVCKALGKPVHVLWEVLAVRRKNFSYNRLVQAFYAAETTGNKHDLTGLLLRLSPVSTGLTKETIKLNI